VQNCYFAFFTRTADTTMFIDAVWYT